jgi:hypothetical protein
MTTFAAGSGQFQLRVQFTGTIGALPLMATFPAGVITFPLAIAATTSSGDRW